MSITGFGAPGKTLPNDPSISQAKEKLKLTLTDSARAETLLMLSRLYRDVSGLQASQVDSAYFYAQQAAAISIASKYWKGLGTAYRQQAKLLLAKGDTTRAKSFTDKAVIVFRENKLFADLGEACFDMTGYHALFGEGLNERIRWAEITLSVFQQDKNILKIADSNKELGDLYQIAGKSVESLKCLRTALKLYNSIHYQSLQGVYDLIGMVCFAIGNYSDAVEYGLRAVNKIEEIGETTPQACTIYNRLAVTYQGINEFAKADFYFRKSLDLAIKHREPKTIYFVATNRISNMQMMGKQGEALQFLNGIIRDYKIPDEDSRVSVYAQQLNLYYLLNNRQKANEISLSLMKSLDDPRLLSLDRRRMAYTALISHLKDLGRADLCKKYLRLHLELSNQTKSLRGVSLNHLWSFQLDSLTGNYISAINHLKRHKLFDDSLFSITKARRIDELQIVYETARKDQELQDREQDIELLTKKSELQSVQFQQTEFMRNVTLAGMLLLSLIILLLYRNFNNRMKTNRALQVKQLEIEDKNKALHSLVKEKEWLVKEIHHRVKNNFHTIIGLLVTQAQYLTKEELVGIEDSQHRIYTLSLVHKKLYQSESLSTINMGLYTHELMDYLKERYDLKGRINLLPDVEQIELAISHAIPIGLIINEVVTNLIKYLFNDHQFSTVWINLSREENDRIRLRIGYEQQDEAKSSLTLKSIDAMGLNLIKGLCDDVDASVSFLSGDGVLIDVVFQYDFESGQRTKSTFHV